MKDSYLIVRDEPPERPDGARPALWSNPDIPRIQELARGNCPEQFSEGPGFFCPYVDPDTGHDCGEDHSFGLPDDFDEAMDALVDVIRAENGTLRCGECNEPLYGLVGNGDHS